MFRIVPEQFIDVPFRIPEQAALKPDHRISGERVQPSLLSVAVHAGIQSIDETASGEVSCFQQPPLQDVRIQKRNFRGVHDRINNIQPDSESVCFSSQQFGPAADFCQLMFEHLRR